ncbi:MAG: glycosyltransferase [Candidatus Nanopelagicales bacterium]
MEFDCVYVSATWGIHDERWTQALRDLGHRPDIIVLDRDATEQTLAAQVTGACRGRLPVLAGPLTSITQHLVRQAPDLTVVGLSWGFDLYELQAAGALDWLHHLGGLVIDSVATREMAIAAGVAPEQIAFIPWGIDLEAFTPEGAALDLAALGIAADQRMVLSLRAHEALYRIADIIDAFAEVASADPSVVLVLGHSGSQTDALRDRVAALGLDDRVRFVGTIEEAALPTWLRAAACYVSAAEVDGTSVTLLQALACATPVVVSDTPGNLGWVEDGVTGVTFTTGSIDGLASALMASLSSNTDASVQAARKEVVNQADWRHNIARLETVLFGSV